MNKLLIPCLVAAFATASSYAAPADDVKAAAKKLTDAANYSWTTTTQNAGGGGGGGFGGGPTSGMAEKSGLSVISREGPNGPTQTIRKGEQTVMQNQDGQWVTLEEMMAQFGGGAPGGAPGGRGGGRGGFGFGGMGGGANPTDELVALADAAKDLKMADGAIMGSLTGDALTQRLSRGGRGGQPPAAPANASGTVKFWLKDGAVSKYEVHVKGTVEGRGGPQEVDRTTTTEIKDVGTTKVDVPAEAKKKIT